MDPYSFPIFGKTSTVIVKLNRAMIGASTFFQDSPDAYLLNIIVLFSVVLRVFENIDRESVFSQIFNYSYPFLSDRT